jgi:hypothetical protein
MLTDRHSDLMKIKTLFSNISSHALNKKYGHYLQRTAALYFIFFFSSNINLITVQESKSIIAVLVVCHCKCDTNLRVLSSSI